MSPDPRLHRKAWLYPWSSAAAHCGNLGRPAPTAKTGTATPLAVPAFDATGLLDLRRWRKMMAADEWRAELTRAEDPATLAQLRTQTGRGRPLGGDSFLSKVEKFVGRRVRPLGVGHDPLGDWTLVVKINGKTLTKKKIGKGTCTDGWTEVTVDLSTYAGKSVKLDLENRANGWSWEAGYWSQIVITSE